MTINDSAAADRSVRTVVGCLLSEGRRPTRRDTAVSLATLGVMLAAVWMRTHSLGNPGTARLIFTALAWLPLLVRTRWPEPVLALVTVLSIVQLGALHHLPLNSPDAVGAYQPIPLACMLAVYTVAANRRQRDGWIAGAACAAALFFAALLFQPLRLLGTDIVTAELVMVAAAVGVGVRARNDARERRAQQAAERTRSAVVDERLRIARELHDTLAHGLALVDAQAGVAEYLLEVDPTAARQALSGIKTHTSAAIDDLRAALELLRVDDVSGRSEAGDDGATTTLGAAAGTDPTADPSSTVPVARLRDLEGVVARVRSTGTTVEFVIEGEPIALDHQRELAVYRIIQEALTNATKHAPGAAITVTLVWTPAELGLEIHNERAQRPPSRPGRGTGNGLIGLRERARSAGGRIDIGPTADGGFGVSAWLPLTAPAHEDRAVTSAGTTKDRRDREGEE